MTSATDWQPSASLETLKARAELLRAIRAFFDERGVMEVDTPVLSGAASVERHIDSFQLLGAGWLNSSPEFAMKRLLATECGPIYQLGHVFRAEPQGKLHNPEFMMLEWYRPAWTHVKLMDEVEQLLRALGVGGAPFPRHTYARAFESGTGIHPFMASLTALKAGLMERGVSLPGGVTPHEDADRDFWLDLWMGTAVGPRLGQPVPTFVHEYPASQAALARVLPRDPPVAARFELFWKGIELANGFDELTDAGEQRKRFEADLAWRKQNGKPAPPHDERLLGALEQGLPACSGVALGVDRLLMLKLGLPELAQVMPFPYDRA
jgi:lysyl-tRNA synthetase class 2